ncbi:non-ribosomal peptide synthetase [Mucilaginibacter lappiensis]|uniref:non-ribosomal peptide synthetase n=1 Tax=Mucilaginibacter lappiensis TaxID=354630 RepID=UPI003D1AE3B4
MSQSYLLNKEVLDNIDQFKDKFQTLPLLKLPIDIQTLTGKKSGVAEQEFVLDTDLLKRLSFFAEEQGCKLSTILLAAYKVLLQRYSTQEDLFITQIICRDLPVENPSSKYGFNSIRSTISGEISFVNIVQQLKATRYAPGYTGNLTFNDLNEILLNLKIDKEVFKGLFGFDESGEAVEGDEIKGLISKHFKDFYLGLFFKETTEGVPGVLYYNASLFQDEFIDKFLKHFVQLLDLIAINPAEQVGRHQLLTSEEWKQIIVDFNDTVAPYPEEKLLFSLFEEQVAKNPDAIALIQAGQVLTYGQLNQQSNRLAHYLIDEGIVPGDNVGILADRDFNMIVGMLGILKAGGAYVPVDPDYPIERQEYIFYQSALKLIIADKSYPLKSLIDPRKFADIDFNSINISRDTNPDIKISSRQLAYTIYTSGSTGRPKGVMIEHHSAVNLVQWVNNEFNVDANDRILFITSMCFDLSVYDIFGMLSAGGQIVIARQEEIRDVKQLQSLLVNHQITFWDSVPTTLDYLILNLETEDPQYRYDGLKTVFLSGDWIPLSLPDRVKKYMPGARVISLGGATEGTVWSNFFPVESTSEKWNSIPYGKPITNNFFYILNKQLQPLPFGVAGDLYIGGAGVARGYANDPDKTAAAFVPDPFNDSLGGMMYRTGDLGRMMPDLNMEFIGRIDNQVKIQGFRIELGEIENVLKGFHLVSNAVVLAKDDQEGKKRLIGYVVPEGGKFNKEAVMDYLGTKLPGYMVPSVWVELEFLPLTSNGKIDRKSLPEVNHLDATDNLVNAVSETEMILQSIWQDCMGIPQISINANFFELGGHSLKAVQILSKFEKRTGKNFQLSVLFKYPDIQSLARFIDDDDKESVFISLVPIKPSGSKTPLYIIHGEGLNVLNFSELAACIDKEQPIYGLQAKGLNDADEPFESIPDIAAHYISEILRHNPEGPYILSGYSFGGYVAVEMNRQLGEMGKKVSMLIMFDTNAEKTEYKDWYKLLPKKVKRNIPKLLTFIKNSVTQPVSTFKNQSQQVSKKRFKKESEKFYQQIGKIKEKHLVAFRKYQLGPFDNKVYLFRAEICVHYVNDTKYLGWKNYARQGVEVLEVPGDHLSMLETPNVEKLAGILERTLDQRC